MEVHRNFWLARRKILASRAALRAWNPRAAVYTVWNPVQKCLAANVGEEPKATALVAVWNLSPEPRAAKLFGVEPGNPWAAVYTVWNPLLLGLAL